MKSFSRAGRADRAGALLLLFLAVPQVYLLPAGLVDVALTTFVTLALVPLILLSDLTGTIRWLRSALFLVLLGLLALRVATLAWSPDPRSGLAPIVTLAQFVLTVVLMCRAVARAPGIMRDLRLVYWPWVAAEIVLVVLFRLLPGVEEGFLRHLGGVFIGHNSVAAYFGDSPNNVTDTAKAGGVFLNANVAAIFLGVNALAALAVAEVTRSRGVRYLGFAALVAVVFTGSKAGTILAVLLPVLAFLVIRANQVTKPVLWRWIAVVVGLAGVTVAALSLMNPALAGSVKDAFAGRAAIWRFGAQAFAENPLLGLGYGGWETGFREYAQGRGLDQDDFPPHNLLLAAWAKNGMLGLLLTVAFLALVAVLVARGLSARSDLDRRFVAFAGAALGWVVIQSMGENTDVFGEIHLIPIVALLIGYLGQHTGEGKDGGKRINRWRAPAPASPSVRDVHNEPGARAEVLPAGPRGQGKDSGDTRDGVD